MSIFRKRVGFIAFCCLLLFFCDGCGSARIPESVEGNTGNLFGASARCNDGTLSYSDNCSGTCSSHGGVNEWYNDCGR